MVGGISCETLSRDLVSASADAMIVTDSRGAVVLWNAAAEALFGYSASEVVGRPMDFIVPTPMRGEHVAGMERLRDGAEPRLIGRAIEVPALRADGSTVQIEMRLSMWRAGQTYFGAVIRELSKRRENEETLHNLAYFDQLTMLPNRSRFLATLVSFLSGGGEGAVLIANLDRFAEVNDRLGSEDADDVLREVAIILKRFARSESADAFVGRIGPNEFGMCVPQTADILSASLVADRFRVALGALSGSDGRAVTASIGVAVTPAHGAGAESAIANADFAVRRAKAAGGDRWQLFQPHQRKIARVRRDLELALNAAWEAGEFEVHYQPQVRLVDKAIVGAEALLRWRHPVRGLVLPGMFMHAMSDSDLSAAVGDFVVRDACRQAAAWRGLTSRPFRMGVNLFEKQFMRPDQAERISAALSEAGLPAECLELEIIETIMTSTDDTSIRRVKRLRDIGVGIAFDDYGTGYASLGLLKRYPITTLKIDRAFVSEVNREQSDRTIVELVLTLGRRFGLRVVAEGVETCDQAEALLALGCSEAQGYLFGRPAPASVLTDMLRSSDARPGALVA